MSKKHENCRSTVGRGVPHPIVLGRKFCARCGHWRHLCDFRPDTGNPGSGLRSYCQACERIRRREAYRQLMLDPVRATLRREYYRIRGEALRREAGIPPRARANRQTVIDQREGIYLPVEPLNAAIDLWDGALEDLASLAGVPERTITRIRHQSRKVQIDVADKLAVALGVPSAVIWEEW